MFARTERLTLRPGWPEDAPALAAALNDPAVARNLARVPLPYSLADAQGWLALPVPLHQPCLLVFAHDRGANPELVGGIAVTALDDRPNELGYWIAQAAWGRGYATEAGRAVLAIARALGLAAVTSGHFADNPASGAVLRKLGFRPTGTRRALFSVAREAEVPTIDHRLDLSGL